MFEATITLGEAIGLGIGIPALTILVWGWCRYLRYRRYPFDYWFQTELSYRGKPPLESETSICVGAEVEVHLRVKPKRPTVLGEVHLRLLDSGNWSKSSFPKRSVAHVADMWGLGLIENEIVGVMEDATNGIQGRYREPHHCAPEKLVHIVAKIVVDRVWDGYLALQLECADGHFRSRYRKLHVKASQENQ